jgi:hypothetical protein
MLTKSPVIKDQTWLKSQKVPTKTCFYTYLYNMLQPSFSQHHHTYFPDVSHAPRVAGKVTEATVEELHGDYFTPMMEAVQRFLWG